MKIIKIFTALLLSAAVLTACAGEDVPASEKVNADDTQTSQETQETEEAVETDPADEELVEYAISHNSLKIWENSIGTIWYQGIVEIENTGNTDLFLSSGKFDIENADGTLFASKDYISVYPQIIKPGEKAYYYDNSTLENADPSAEYKIVPKIEAKKSTTDQIYLASSEFRIEDTEYLGMKAIGRIENTTEEEQSLPKVVVVCYGSDGKPIEIMFTYGDTIAVGEKTGIEASPWTSPPDITAEDVADFAVYVYPDQYQW